MEEANEQRLRLLLAAVLLLIVVGGTVDLYLDQPQRWLSAHVVYEVLLIAAGLVGATALWMGWWRAERSVLALRQSLEEHDAERDRWRESARASLQGLGAAIDRQFGAWGFTPTEREIALLLLQGHSHKAISVLTGRSERTVRQHAVAAYHKAGLSGRAELSAYFLADLMPSGSARKGTRPGSEAAATPGG